VCEPSAFLLGSAWSLVHCAFLIFFFFAFWETALSYSLFFYFLKWHLVGKKKRNNNNSVTVCPNRFPFYVGFGVLGIGLAF
jgi:hypothetical protein